MITFNHAGIFVSNIEESIRFYTEVLGFEIAIRRTTPTGDGMVYLRCPGGQLELIHNPSVVRPIAPPEFSSEANIRHVAFKTDDLDALARKLESAGVQFRTPPRPAASGYGRLMFVYDPDYNQLEFIQRDTDW